MKPGKESSRDGGFRATVKVAPTRFARTPEVFGVSEKGVRAKQSRPYAIRKESGKGVYG